MIEQLAKLVARHLLTFLGGAGVAAAENDVVQLASALATIVGLSWSYIEKRRAQAKPE